MSSPLPQAGRLFAWLLVAGVLAGCEGDDRQALRDIPVEPSATLATVDGTPITRAQLELTIERTLGDSAPLFASEGVERKILESLVSSRAMARLAERELDAAERAQLDLKTQAYREELLVRHYLEAHADPEPVSIAMVSDYYQRHLDEFGGGVVRSFEVIASTRPLDERERTELIALLSSVEAQSKDWEALVAKWRAGGSPLEYRHNRLKPDLLEQPMRNLVKQTAVGAIAPLHIKEQLLLVRVTAEQQLPARPLAEVSGEIREKLAPRMLKQAVQGLSAKALQEVKVEYGTP